jgi:hypothetical protein
MTLPLDGTAGARITAPVRGIAYLIELVFTTGTQRVTTAPQAVVSGGNTWTAVGAQADVSALSQSEDPSGERFTIGLTATNTAMLALALGAVDTYRGRPARVYVQLFDEQWQPAGAAVLCASGYMDKVQITRRRSPPEGGDSVGRIEMLCSRAGMARARNNEGLRLTDAQQQQRYPGDTGLSRVQALLEAPGLWLSKRFQEQ